MRKAIILIFVFLVFAKISYAINEILPADRSFDLVSNPVPQGMCYDRGNNTIYVVDGNSVQLEHYTTDGTPLGTPWTLVHGDNNPSRGVVCNSTHVIIGAPEATGGQGTIRVWKQDGTYVEEYNFTTTTPVLRGLAMDKNQSYLYMRDTTNFQIDIYKKSTTTSGWDYDTSFSIPSTTTYSAGVEVVNTSQGYFLYIIFGNANDAGIVLNISRYNLTGNFGAYDNYALRYSHAAEKTNYMDFKVNVTLNGSIQFFYVNDSLLKVYQASLDVSTTASAPPPDTPPSITKYNMTSEGGAGCINWDTNKTNACITSDTTPTVNLTTDEPAWCAIGRQDINFSDYNNLVLTETALQGKVHNHIHAL